MPKLIGSCARCGNEMVQVMHSCCYNDCLLWCPRCGSIRWGAVEAPSVHNVPEKYREQEREDGRYTTYIPAMSMRQ